MPLDISVSHLSLGAQGDDVVRLHRALQALGRAVPVSETRPRALGPATAAVVKALQEELALQPTGNVDAATVRAINAALARLDTAPRVVRGRVRDASGNAFARASVRILAQVAGTEQVLGTALLGADGGYRISYELPPDSHGRVDLRVAVHDDRGALVETTPSGTNLLANAGPLEVVDFVLSGDQQPAKVEFELLLEDLKPLLGTRDVAELTEDDTRRDVSVLAQQSGYSPEQVAALARAHKLAKETGTPAPVFYGMLRQGLPFAVDALHAVHPNERTKALKLAVGLGLVPKEVDGKKIEDHLAGFVPSSHHQLQGLLGRVLNASELATFVGQYLKDGRDPAAFWRQTAADPTWANRAADLKFTVQLGALTNNHVPLVTALEATPGVSQPADLASMTDEQWKSLVRTQGVGVPAETPGATAAEKTDNYVAQIMAQVEAAFPTQFVAARLGNSRVATFLKAAPAYDLKSTYPEQFFKANPVAAQALRAEDRQQLQNFQRVYRLTENARETIGLAAKGIHSAQQIARIDRTAFARAQQDVLPEGRANAVYDRALRVNALALALFGEHSTALNRTGTSVLPRLDGRQQAELAANSIPDWQSLFGAFDLCACEQCASVHGPAAYLVDVLRFLGDRNARGPLFERRPDLGDLELSCENANTPLPHIDLVNEILEDAVAPPPPFAVVTLDPALEADLAQTLATTALAAAFTPPLEGGARVEVIESEKRWRVWDALFAYSVVKEGAALKVAARSRQTTGSAGERRATPQYRNIAAYAELGRSVFPWILPLDLPRAEATVFFAHLRVTRRDLIEALRPTPDPFDPNAPVVVRLAAERLGLTDDERRILVGEPLTPPRAPEDFWGSVPVAQLTTVQEILDRSGLRYAELETLVATWFINPSATLTIAAKPDAPVDTCDTGKLELAGLTTDVLARIYRFVRLWRKLGWTIPEVDRTIRALLPNAATPVLTNEVLVRLDHLRTLSSRLRLPVAHTLALWKPIDTIEPRSLYTTLFYNPVVFKPQDEIFRLRADGQEVVHDDALLADHAAALQAVFRLDSAAFSLLVQKTDGRLSLASLSLLYRHAALSRQLDVTVPELITAIELTGLDPFRADRTQDCVRLVDVVRAVRSSRFDFRQLDYLLRHRFNPASSLAPEDLSLAQTLAEVRAGLGAVDAAAEAERQKLRRSAVIDRIAAAIELPADTTSVLLERISHTGRSAQQRFEELLAIAAEPLSRHAAGPQFETLEKLLKVVTVIKTLDLPESRLEWLLRENAWLAVAPDPQSGPVPFARWFSLIQLQQLRRDLALEDAALEAILLALDRVSSAADDPARLVAKAGFVDALEKWLGWRKEDVATLVGKTNDVADRGLLGVHLADDYGIDLVARLHRAMSLLKRVGVSALEANAWCEAVVTEANAKAIRSAAKGKHDDESWHKLAVPLHDTLRELQREALVGYLVARPAQWGAAGVADAHALYAHFLVDTEMSACQLTSRTKQAMSSVQLFVQRCLMGLEADVQTEDPKWSQWAWMKNFRVWEANRRVWLYPETWIEPQLRDDKTPFFEDLESELMQSDLDDVAAEQALRRYLERLDEVARLEIVGVYEDGEDKSLYVFGRTFNTPRTYYFRSRKGVAKAWLPWRKIELDIEGDHLIPVIWNRKLVVIWPVFLAKVKEKPVVMPPPGQAVASGERFWEIQLAWSEYQNGRWSGKSLSAPVSLKAYQDEPNVLFGPRIAAPQNTMMLMINDGGVGSEPPFDGGDPDPDPGDPNPPPGNPSTPPPSLVGKELFSFKGLVFGDTLIVRGFLRRDYRGGRVPADAQIACCFGEFRFSGCRKIVTTAHRGKVHGAHHPLGPSGTKFDHMWFTGTSSGLTLFDGKFPVFPVPPEGTILNEVNEFESIAGDPSATVANKIDIPVLDRTPWSVRLLAPHQDPQFVCDRPFFVMDGRRTFVATSTGASGKSKLPDLGHWVVGDLAVAWRADYFPQLTPTPSGDPTPATPVTGTSLQPFTVLVRGADGRRVARRLAPVTMNAPFQAKTLLPRFWTTRQYTFANFHHPYLCELVRIMNRQGIAGLLSHEAQRLSDPQSFAAYAPEPRVREPHPIDEIEFQSGRAYEIYNWELFFHIPLLIADQLSKNQRFEDAQRWFHFIFDPTGASGGEVPQRYWRTKPFHARLAGDYAAESVKTLEEIIASGPSEEMSVAVEVWRSNPFSPHAVARLRTTAYQKTVVMKYIDNLVAWGDQLFRRETLESIGEATHLYVLAAEILGRRPEVIRRRVNPAVETFNSLEPKLGALGNAVEQIELLVADAGESAAPDEGPDVADPPTAQTLYFCVPENEKLLGYWRTVADRLFKIRHCMNIEGQVRELPLFEPEFDPALFVRARAAGLSIAEVLSEMSVALPHYRFSVMLQKATEVVAEVRNLAALLLSAIEKRDAEALSVLRSGQELRLLQAVRDVRSRQIEEAKAFVAGLEFSRESVEARKTYYEGREFQSERERASGKSLTRSQYAIAAKLPVHALAAVLQKMGKIKAGSPTTAGIEFGGSYFGNATTAMAAVLDTGASVLSVESQLEGRLADFDRRKDEWDHQASLATIELKQIDKQLAAAEIRLAIAEKELRQHEQQIDDARDVDQFLRGKYTSQDLYQWMVGQISGVYFQSYQLAYDLGKRAELCMQHELGLEYGKTSFVRFGYWDSLRKGLLSGDHLAHDLRRLEVAYLDGNVREYELTKHVSLVSLAPEQLIALKEAGVCEFEVPEWLFDLDTPGHYMRRLRSVSLTVPCVVGPYAAIHCKARLIGNSYRQSADLASGYARLPASDPGGPDSRFVNDRMMMESIVTSTGQNDAGLFEPSLADERYLPFERAGAISRWQLELPMEFKTFDYTTISDVILHLRYTARDGGDALRAAAAASVTELLGVASTRALQRLFSLRHEFPAEWHRFQSSPVAPINTITVELTANRLPYFVQGRIITFREAHAIARTSDGSAPVLGIAPGTTAPVPGTPTWTGQEGPGAWTIGTSADPKLLEDIFVVVAYTV